MYHPYTNLSDTHISFDGSVYVHVISVEKGTVYFLQRFDFTDYNTLKPFATTRELFLKCYIPIEDYAKQLDEKEKSN